MDKSKWTYKKLGEVCEILDSQRKPITKSKRESGTIPYYGATGCLDYVKDYIFDEKLVLLGEDGAKWGAGENSAYIIEGKSWVNNHAHALKPKRDILVDELLVYYLNFSNLLPYISGVTVPKLNQEKMRSIEIPIGPVNEQQSIVDYLDSAFAKIDTMKANAEKALNEARILFQKALTKAMEPKEGWEEKTLKDIADFVRGPFGGSLTKSMFKSTGYAVYEQQHAIHKHINIRYYIDSKKYKEMERFSVEEGDIIMSCSGVTLGRVNILPSNAPAGIINQALLKMKVKKGFDTQFFKLWLESTHFQNIIIEYSGGAAIPNVPSVKILKDILIKIPSLSEQQRIVDRLDTLSANVKRLEEIQQKTITECDALKQAILRQVFE